MWYTQVRGGDAGRRRAGAPAGGAAVRKGAAMGTCRILSRSTQPFRDRLEAARLLAQELSNDLEGEVVVLGIPRGGVLLARELADRLGAALDVVLVRKLGAPGNPELAIGAVTEDGRVVMHEAVAGSLGADRDYVQRETQRQYAVLCERKEAYRGVSPRVPLEGRTAVVTDDGVATGATLLAALWAVRDEAPDRLIAAVPVGPEGNLRRLAQDADELICLRAPPGFAAVGQFYVRFEQVSDRQVIQALRERPGSARQQ